MEHVGIRPCTPPHLRPRVDLSKLSNEAVPALKFRSNFLQTVKPKWWTLEGYFDHGYLDVDDYLHDLALFSKYRAKGPQVILMWKHCYTHTKFYKTEDGKMLLRLMKADHTARKESQVAILNATIAGFRGQVEGQSSTTDTSSSSTTDMISSRSTIGQSSSSSKADPVDDDFAQSLPALQELQAAMEEPWKTLTAACIDKIQHRSVDDFVLPDIDVQGLEDVLLEQVLTLLSKPDISPIDSGAMLTALTGIVDLRRHCLEGYSVSVPELEEQDEDVTAILKQLSQHLKLGPYVLFLKCEVTLGEYAQGALLGKDMPPVAPLVRLVRDLALMVHQETVPVSESEVVALWKHCLELLSDGVLKFRSGEVVCTATTSQKKFFTQLFKVAYDTESGRKVDLMLLVNNLEALNSEAKASENRAPCERQYLKNLRINHAMHVVAAKKGVQLPRMNPLDIRGMSAMVCGLQAEGDLFLGGAACRNTIDLPTNRDELAIFLSGPSATLLWNYTKLLLNYQERIKEQLRLRHSISVTAPESLLQTQEAQDQTECRTPPQSPTLYGIGKVTALTPKISKKRQLPVSESRPSDRVSKKSR